VSAGFVRRERSLRGDGWWRTTGHLIANMAARLPDKPAVVDDRRAVTYGDLAEDTERFAAALMASGVERGDRVAIWAPNAVRYVIAALGAQTAGAAIVPINTRYKGREAAYLLEQSAPRALVVDNGFLDNDYLGMLEGESHDLGGMAAVVLMEGGDPRGTAWEEFVARGDGIPSDQVRARRDEVMGDDVSDVMFTSGTTGHPKGVLTTHAQNLKAYLDWSTLAGMREDDRYLIVNPFFHAFGYKVGWLATLMHGMTCFPHATLDVDRVLAQVEAEKITVLPGPPTLYHSLLARAAETGHDLSSLRLAITGAATVPASLVRRMSEELGFERVTTCYGMTEGTGIATITREDDDLETVAGTSGRALPEVELSIRGADGQEVAAGEPGEVWLRGYNVMQGYLGAPEETAARVDDEGWLHTADIGTLDERGLRVTDRLGDMFVVGGFNAYPAEIENLLIEHEAVADVAVIGVPDERMGEVGKAFVVAAPGTAPDPAELIAWTEERLANFKVPRTIEIVDALPRNATGKVLKHELRGAAA
jgi:acyl-CoA synthetase (AMP-forming)/AMP-acid ligase II